MHPLRRLLPALACAALLRAGLAAPAAPAAAAPAPAAQPATASAAVSLDRYRSLWRAPALEERIRRGIETNRKGDAVIEVVGRDGKPVPGARVSYSQTGHEFLFGCNAFVLGQLDTDAKNRTYEESFARLFNFATVPLYWEGTEPQRGQLRYEDPAPDMWRRPPAGRYLEWGARYGITLKGHPLLWHMYNPPWLPQDAAELRQLYQKRFREIAARFAGRIPIFDVVNESLVCKKTYPLYSEDRAYVKWAFDQAAPLFPDAELMINEVTTYNFPPAATNAYRRQVAELLKAGAAVRGIGFQYHFFSRGALDKYLAGSQCDPAKLLDLYESFAEFGLPLWITEITFGSAGDNGEALQAEVVRDHYRLWFSVPRMAGITWWNLGDGTAVKSENGVCGGLLDANLQPKAVYRELEKLLRTEWRSDGASATAADGRASFRGFYGHYRIAVTTGSEVRHFEITLARGVEAVHRLRL